MYRSWLCFAGRLPLAGLLGWQEKITAARQLTPRSHWQLSQKITSLKLRWESCPCFTLSKGGCYTAKIWLGQGYWFCRTISPIVNWDWMALNIRLSWRSHVLIWPCKFEVVTSRTRHKAKVELQVIGSTFSSFKVASESSLFLTLKKETAIPGTMVKGHSAHLYPNHERDGSRFWTSQAIMQTSKVFVLPCKFRLIRRCQKNF